MAKWLMVLGAIILVVGAMLQYAPWLVNWFGRLPGDIRIKGENSFVFIPITSLIIISVVLTLIASLLNR